MSDKELERLRQIECSNFGVDIVDKAVITIKKMQQEKQEIIKWLKDNIIYFSHFSHQNSAILYMKYIKKLSL